MLDTDFIYIIINFFVNNNGSLCPFCKKQEEEH